MSDKAIKTPAMNAASPTIESEQFWYELSMVRLQKGEFQQNKRATEHLIPFINAWGASLAAPVGQGCAKPSEAETMLAMRAESDRQQAAKRGTLAGQGSAMVPSSMRVASEGSATSGEAAPVTVESWSTRKRRDGRFVQDDSYYMACEIADLRAALAAKAEQSNTPVPRVGGNTKPCRGTGCCDLSCLSCGGSGATSVAERAAAPTSVPEGWTLAPAEPTKQMIDRAWLYGNYASGDAPDPVYFYEAIIAAAPEVAQPAAQGESIDTPEFWKVVKVWDDIPYGDANNEWQAIIDFIHAWGAIQRQEAHREGIEEAAALFDTSPHAEEFRVNIAESIRALKSLATPAPTAGEPSATQPLKLHPASEYHEDYSDVLWFAFLSFNEAPQVYCGSPLEVSPEFDDEHWTHFARIDWNDAIGQAEAMDLHIKATQGGKDQDNG